MLHVKRITELMHHLAAMMHYLHSHHLKPKYRNRLLFIAVFITVCLIAVFTGQHAKESASTASSYASVTKLAKTNHTPSYTAAEITRVTPKKIDWKAPSESRPYPDVSKHPNLSLHVNLKKQRVFIKDGSKTLYTMYASTGIDDATPHGDFTIQDERGYEFFNPNEQMGAHYYTSFYLHGTYLFHSVPTDINGNYIQSEAAKLGKKPGSHGCVRLSISDAKWIYEHIPTGTPVSIH
nr:L,D-transpeptidase [Lacticaseibacillus rhamnosus]